MISVPAPKRRPNGASLTIAAILALIAVVIFRDAASLPQARGYSGVGPADVPRWIAWGLIVLSVWSAIAAFREGPCDHEPQDIGPIFWIIGGLAVQLALLNTVGFVLATGLLFAATARAFGKRNLMLTFPVGLVFSLIIYVIFAGLLDLGLPAGPLERLVLGG